MLKTARPLLLMHLELHLRLATLNLLLVLRMTSQYKVVSLGEEHQTRPLAVGSMLLHRTINKLLSRTLVVLHSANSHNRVVFQLLLNKLHHNSLNKAVCLAVVLLSGTWPINPLLLVLQAHLGTVGLYPLIYLQVFTALVPSNAKCFWHHEPRNQRVWSNESACPTTSQCFWRSTAGWHAEQFWDRITR